MRVTWGSTNASINFTRRTNRQQVPIRLWSTQVLLFVNRQRNGTTTFGNMLKRSCAGPRKEVDKHLGRLINAPALSTVPWASSRIIQWPQHKLLSNLLRQTGPKAIHQHTQPCRYVQILPDALHNLIQDFLQGSIRHTGLSTATPEPHEQP